MNLSRLFTALFCILIFVGPLNAQQKKTFHKSAALNQAAVMEKSCLVGNEILPPVAQTSENHPYRQGTLPRVNFDREVVLGETFYDLQSNGTTQNRIFRRTDGQINAVWTFSGSEGGGFPDRGAAYTFFDGSDWPDDIPSVRLESERSGWPGYALTSENTEVVISHNTDQTPFSINILTREEGAMDWSEQVTTFGWNGGLLWPRVAAGANNTVHMVCVTTPLANENGAMLYKGVDGHILYFRSSDGGSTWDQQLIELPMMDSLNFSSMAADSYAIDADGDVVAVGLYSDFGDVLMAKSEDGGDTWNTTIVHDFPLEQYTTNDGYTFDDLGGEYDPDTYPDSLAIFTSDGSGAVIIDATGTVHIAFGEMFVADIDTMDAGTTFYPATGGMSYWNESFGPDGSQSITIVDSFLDVNGNDTLDIASTDDIAQYFQSLTTMPSFGLNAEGDLFMAYSQVMENFFSDEDAQHYRHIYLTKLDAATGEWVDPVDLVNEETLTFPDFLASIEGVFPSAARLVDDKVHLVYQQDFRPGLNVRGDEDVVEVNFIPYLGVDPDFDVISDTEEPVAPEVLDMQLTPNPATNIATLQYEVQATTQVSVSIFNMVGKQVLPVAQAETQPGTYQHFLNVRDLAPGMYYVQLTVGNQTATQKLAVQ